MKEEPPPTTGSSLRWRRAPSPGPGSRPRPFEAGLRPAARVRRTSFRDRLLQAGAAGRRLGARGLGSVRLVAGLLTFVVLGGAVGIVISQAIAPDGGTVIFDEEGSRTWDVGVAPEPWSSDVDWSQLVTVRGGELAEEPEAVDLTGDIATIQQRLTELHYYVGPVDGQQGPQLQSAVMAFQKVQGLGADGVLGPATIAALETPQQPTLRGGESNRVEVDLTRQVLYLVKGGRLERIVPVSSGSGEQYQTAEGPAVSLTPVGTYRVERRIRGVREAELGTLYDPLYFYKGWAIHGSNSVPAHPASHGCVRVTRWDATWLFDRVPNGTQVLLYGGTHVFTAGSDAPGTDNPAGDTFTVAAPMPDGDTPLAPDDALGRNPGTTTPGTTAPGTKPPSTPRAPTPTPTPTSTPPSAAPTPTPTPTPTPSPTPTDPSGSAPSPGPGEPNDPGSGDNRVPRL